MGSILRWGDSVKDDKKLIVWICPKGHPCLTGFLSPLESTFRICGVTVGRDENGEPEPCNTPMEVAYDERPHPAGPLTERASEDEKRIRISAALQEAQRNLRSGSMFCAEIVDTLGVGLRGIGSRRIKKP
jgi:hypothetical protein